MKILHFGDIHARDANISELEKCFEAVIEGAAEARPDLIVNTGDTFDRRDITLASEASRVVFSAFSRLSEVAPIAVLLGTPSHDGVAPKLLRFAELGHNILVSAEMPETFVMVRGNLFREEKQDPGSVEAVVSMVPGITKKYWGSAADIEGADREISEAMGDIFGGFAAGFVDRMYNCPHILVGHFSVEGAVIMENQTMTGREVVVTADQLRMSGADLVCLGHLHKAQKIESNIYYNGSLYPLNFGEIEAKGFWIHEDVQEGEEFESRFVEIPSRKMIKMEFDFTDEAVPDITLRLQEALLKFNEDYTANALRSDKKSIALDNVVFRGVFRVWQDQAAEIDQAAVARSSAALGVGRTDVQVIRVPRENVRSERLLRLDSLREKVQERAALAGEDVAESILRKCDVLEMTDLDGVVAGITVFQE